MSAVWISIACVALSSAVLKGAGPLLVGGRELPGWSTAVITLLAPALLTALVVVETFGADGRLELDARALGVGAAGVALLLRAPMLVAIALAALVTAAARALT